MVLTKHTRDKIVITLIAVAIIFIVHTQESFYPITPIDILHLWIGIIIVGMICIFLIPHD